MSLGLQWAICALILAGAVGLLIGSFARPRAGACGCKKCPAAEQMARRLGSLGQHDRGRGGRPV